MSHAGSRWTSLAGAAALALLAGCGEYSSGYRPPQDGRARVLWNGNGVFAAVPQGAVSTECMRAMDEAQERPDAYFRGYSGYRGGTRVYWAPGVYIGPPIVVVHHAPSGPLHPVRHFATPTSGGGGHSSLLGNGSGGGGSGDGGKAIAVVAAVVVLLALPAVTLSLAAGRPEPEKSVALAIDQVNAYNDLARYPGTPCSPEATGGPQ